MATNAPRILPEILLHVFSYLPLLDTLSVSQVSHDWRFWSRERLYSAPSLTKASSVPFFLRTLLTPGLEPLATHVRSLTVESTSFDADTIGQSDRAIIKTAAAYHGLDHIFGSAGVHTLLLLHLLSRLNTLTLYLPDQPDTLNNFLCGTHKPQDLPLAFQSISHLSCTWAPRASDNVPQKLLTLFGLPRVHTLRLFSLKNIEVSFSPSQHNLSAVTSLRIPASVISCSSLGHILHLPRALTRLYFTGTITYHLPDSTGLQVALEPLRMTLQELEFVIDGDPWSEDASVSPPSVSFRTWPVLRRLRCQLIILVGSMWEVESRYLEDVLPLCLRDFGVLMENDWYYDDVARRAIGLLGKKEMVVPALERLVCFTDWMDEDLAEQLNVACRFAGVLLTEFW